MVHITSNNIMKINVTLESPIFREKLILYYFWQQHLLGSLGEGDTHFPPLLKLAR